VTSKCSVTPDCPFYHEKVNIYFHTELVNFTEAEKICTSKGLHLASPRNSEEFKRLSNYVKKRNPYGDFHLFYYCGLAFLTSTDNSIHNCLIVGPVLPINLTFESVAIPIFGCKIKTY